MATRDLTTTYMRQRSALHRKAPSRAGVGRDESGAASLTAGGETVDTSDIALSASPVYVETVNEINAEVQAIQQKMAELQRVHEARLKAFAQTEQQEKEREVDIMTSAITRAFNVSGNKLKRIANATEGAADAELKIRRNVQRGLATRLHDLSMEFKGMQKVYIGHLSRQRQREGIGSMFDTEAPEDTDEGFTDEQMNALARQREDVNERLNDIRHIAQQVEQLATLFKELSTLIIEQGTILDRIDHNMEEAVEHTKKGIKELEVAEKYQKSARPMWCMVALMVLIVICVIIIIAKTSNK